jgi:hypothetical protein
MRINVNESRQMNLMKALKNMGACDGSKGAIPWVNTNLQPQQGLLDAWLLCQNKEWLLWLLEHWKLLGECTCTLSIDSISRCPIGKAYNLEFEDVQANYRDDIACIAYYTGL